MKIENHIHAISLYFMHYNFAEVHQTLRVTPAMEAGVAGNVQVVGAASCQHLWTVRDIVEMAESFSN